MCIVVENDSSIGKKADIELDRFKQILNNKTKEKNNQIFASHSMAYNINVQYEINCLRWVLEKTNQRIQIRMDHVENIIQKEINDLNGKMNAKSVNMQKRDMFITSIETLSWILYVIHSIGEKGLHWKLII